MALIEQLIEFFVLDANFTTFTEFLPWFCKLILAVFLIAFIFKCLFMATWKIKKDLR